MNNDTSATADSILPTPKFCDWRIELYHCELSELWVAQVAISLATYVLLFISGTFIFVYRYKHMWKGLFVDHAQGIRPLPVDNLLFFWTISCFLKGIHCILMLADAYTRYWQREFMQEIGWTTLCYGGILYLIGIIYTIPVNYTRGTTATIKLESKKDSLSYFTSREIYIPTPKMLNVILAVWCLYPTAVMLPFATLSGLAKDHGNYEASIKWTAAQYLAYVVFNLSFAVIGAYYGIHFMLILRNSMKQFSRRSGGYYQSNSNATRGALDRLKYTMTYITVLPIIACPWWGILGLYHGLIINSVNGVNIFCSTFFLIGGCQPITAVCQFTLAKRVYQHFTGQIPSDNFGSSAASASASTSMRSAMSPVSPSFPVTMSSAVLRQNQQDRRESDATIDYFHDMDNMDNNWDNVFEDNQNNQNNQNSDGQRV